MFNYLAFLDGGIEAPTTNSIEDGRRLAGKCMEKLNRLKDKEQFPPKLLILLASPVFFSKGRANLLIEGIYKVFKREVRLIGSSAAAVFFRNESGETRIYPDGALLICLASRLMEPRLAISAIEPAAAKGKNGREGSDVNKSIDRLVKRLALDTSLSESVSQLPHRLILSFFPNFGSNDIEARELTDELQNKLWQKVHYMIPIVGGVSSVNDPKRQAPSYQILDRKVVTKSIVAASISCGVPFDESLSNGINWEEPQISSRALTSPRFSKSRLTINGFDKATPSELFKKEDGIILFKEGGRSSDRVVAIYEPRRNSKLVRVLRKLSDDVQLVAGKPDPDVMYRKAKDSLISSLKSMGIENPIGCFSIKCTSHYRRQGELGLDIEQGISLISERVLNSKPYVGGFMDGEIGTDHTGRSRYGNWCVATLVFGDEMSESALIQRGYASMKKHTADLSSTFELGEVIDKTLELIYDIGFPGAMISLLLPDFVKTHLRSHWVVGSRFKRIKDMTSREFDEAEIRERLMRSKTGTLYIPNSKKDSAFTNKAVERSGIISRFLIRLKDPNDTTLGLVQVDLGDAKRFYPAESSRKPAREVKKRKLPEEEQRLLESIGAFVGACLNRVLSWKQNEILHKLDEAKIISLSKERMVDGLTTFINEVIGAFGVKMGHIRLFDERTRSLSLVAGVGKYFDAATNDRDRVNDRDESPGSYAFSNEKLIIVNDARKNETHLKLCARYDGVPRMKRALNLVRSYANVPFKSPNGVQGTFNLLSETEWFFNSYHRPALGALALTVGMVVDDLIRKDDESFLQVASPRLSEITSFDEINNFYDEATKTFCEALGAEQGALYLQEKDISAKDPGTRFHILRAQYCWKGEDRVGTAFYRDDEGWIGNEAVGNGEILFVPDLNREYQDPKYHNPVKRYAKDIFGDELSNTGPVEALAIPLKMGHERLGVLTVYRRKNSHDANCKSGFRTIKPELIEQAVKEFAGWTNHAWNNQIEYWGRANSERGQSIYHALSSLVDPGPGLLFESPASLETAVCDILLKELVAARVDFYKWIPKKRVFKWIAAANSTEQDTSEPGAFDKPVKEMNKMKELAEIADAAEDISKVGYKVYQKSTLTDTKEIAFKGILQRACVPLLSSNRLVGFLDLQWNGEKRQDPPLLGKTGARHLLGLGKSIGSVYNKHLLRQDSERRRIAFHIVDSVARGKSHVLRRYVNRLKDTLKGLQGVRSRADEAKRASEIADQIAKLLSDRMELANQFLRSFTEKAYYSANVKQIVDALLEGLSIKDLDELSVDERHRFKPANHVDKDINVIGIPVLVEFVLSNLIDNAIEQMKKVPKVPARRHTLTVESQVDHAAKTVIVSIRDTGPGIEPGILERITQQSGPLTTGDGAGLGIYLCKEILGLMRGDLALSNNEDGGVTAKVTLNLGGTEDTR